MQTDFLKSTMFSDGEKGLPTPPGIRMQGIYAASTGFSLEFFPESVILGCGPDSARAYPYTVVADGSKPVVRINAPDLIRSTLLLAPEIRSIPAALRRTRSTVASSPARTTMETSPSRPLERTCNCSHR